MSAMWASPGSSLTALAQRLRLAFQWPTYRAYLESKPGEGVDQVVAIDPVQHALALPLAGHQASILENRQMGGNGRRGHRKPLRQFGCGQLRLREVGEDLASWHRSEGFENPVE